MVKVSYSVQMVRVRGRGKHYIYESPHKVRSNRMTVCVCVLNCLKIGK